MVNPSTESILNQMTNLAMDIALDYVLPASPMSDVCKSDLFEFERDVVVAAVSGGATADGLLSSLVAGTAGTAGGCCGRPPTDLCKKNSYMGAAGCDSCDACLARNAAATAAADLYSPSTCTTTTTTSAVGLTASPPSSSASSTTSSASSTPSQQQTAETTMDISWCQFDGCEFDTADNSYLDICDWIFYADRYALTDENREKVQKAFQMVPPGEVTGYVAEPPKHAKRTNNPTGATTLPVGDDPSVAAVAAAAAAAAIVGGVTVKSEPDDDYLWTSDNHLLPIILKAEPNADILQITELDHSYLQTPTSHGGCGSTSSSTAVSPAKHHPNHLVDMLGLVTPPPSRSQSSGEYTPFIFISIFQYYVVKISGFAAKDFFLVILRRDVVVAQHACRRWRFVMLRRRLRAHHRSSWCVGGKRAGNGGLVQGPSPRSAPLSGFI